MLKSKVLQVWSFLIVNDFSGHKSKDQAHTFMPKISCLIKNEECFLEYLTFEAKVHLNLEKRKVEFRRLENTLIENLL